MTTDRSIKTSNVQCTGRDTSPGVPLRSWFTDCHCSENSQPWKTKSLISSPTLHNVIHFSGRAVAAFVGRCPASHFSMCRWIFYYGEEVCIAKLIFGAVHGLATMSEVRPSCFRPVWPNSKLFGCRKQTRVLDFASDTLMNCACPLRTCAVRVPLPTPKMTMSTCLPHALPNH